MCMLRDAAHVLHFLKSFYGKEKFSFPWELKLRKVQLIQFLLIKHNYEEGFFIIFDGCRWVFLMWGFPI